MLRDPEVQFDQVVYGSMGGRWQEIDQAAAEKGFGRNFLTGMAIAKNERKRIMDSGASIIDKDTFDLDDFMNRFFPEGQPKEMR